jgi:ferrous iron transport protein A
MAAAHLETDPPRMASLDQLQRGQRATVTALEGDDAIVQRLLEMGLLEGEEIEVLGFAPLGDPMEIRLRDYRLSLRRSEAARITVRFTPGAAPRLT